MEALFAALATLPHWVVALFSCSIFATGCALPEPHIATPISPARPFVATIMSATPTSPLTPQHATQPLHPLLPNAGDLLVSTSGSQGLSTSIASHTSASNGNTTVTTVVNGETKTISHPNASGVSNTMISITENGNTSVYATTTPLSEADVAQIEDHIEQQLVETRAAIEQSMTDMHAAHSLVYLDIDMPDLGKLLADF